MNLQSCNRPSQRCAWVKRPPRGITIVLLLSAVLAAALIGNRAFFGASLADPGVQYAHDWWQHRNQEYADYECNDCANFTSQCLRAARFSLQGGTLVDKYACTPGASNLASWLNTHNSNTASIQSGGTVPDWVGPGCVVTFTNSQGSYVHAGYVVSGSGPAAKYASHCNDRWEANVTGGVTHFGGATFWAPSSGGGEQKPAVSESTTDDAQ